MARALSSASESRDAKRGASSLARSQRRAGITLVAPATIALTLAFGIPLLALIYFSLTEFRLGSDPHIVGIKNYQKILGSPAFANALRNTVVFVVVYVPSYVALSLGLALMLNQRLRVIPFFRTVYFIPVVVSVTSVSVMALWIFDSGLGLLSWIARQLGLPGQSLLLEPNTAMLVVIIVSLWLSLGYGIAIFVAALQGIPDEQYEAAAIDGAGSIARFKHVTLPWLSHILFFVVLTQIVFAFQAFEQILILTHGGPGVGGTTTLVYEIYRLGFERFDFGAASATGVVLLVIVLAVTLVNFRYFLPRDFE